MPYLSLPAVAAVFLLATVSVVVGFLSAKIYRTISESSKQSMTKLKLKPEKTKTEFKHLFLGNFVMLAGLIMFAYGAYMDEDLYRNIGRVGFTIFALIVLHTVYNWERRL